MPVESASSVRAAAADHRAEARHVAHAQAVAIADSRRDQRVQEARAAAAARPRPQDRAAHAPRGPSSGLLLDVLV
jgi:hypothetical protein